VFVLGEIFGYLNPTAEVYVYSRESVIQNTLDVRICEMLGLLNSIEIVLYVTNEGV